MVHNTIIGIVTYRPYYNKDNKQINLLGQCLESINKNTELTNVYIIVANNSEDGQTIRYITDTCSKYKNIILLNFEKNLGTSAAKNIITRYFNINDNNDNIIVILDDDTMVYPYWLDVTKFILEKNPDIGVIGYDLWYSDNPFNYMVPNDIKIWANECIFPNGAAIAFRREIFDKIGGFDEQFFIGLEDVDFGIRLIKSGYFNYNVGTSNENNINEYHLVRHVGGATGYSSTNSQEKWIIKHNILFPLNPNMEENIKKERNRNITLELPIIINQKIGRTITTKLNIKCGDHSRSAKEPEWTDIDVINNDVKLDFIKDSSIDEIESTDSIERIDNLKYKNVFREFYRVLKPGGDLHINVPDLLWPAKKIIEYSGDLDRESIIRRCIFGDQNSPEQYHHTGFTKTSITKDLKDVGFSYISAQQGIWHNNIPCIDIKIKK